MVLKHGFAGILVTFLCIQKGMRVYNNTGHGKPRSLHGLFTLCESLRDYDGLVVVALIDPHVFWLFVLLLSNMG